MELRSAAAGDMCIAFEESVGGVRGEGDLNAADEAG